MAMGRAGSADEPGYRRELAGCGGADVDMEGLVVAEHRWV